MCPSKTALLGISVSEAMRRMQTSSSTLSLLLLLSPKGKTTTTDFIAEEKNREIERSQGLELKRVKYDVDRSSSKDAILALETKLSERRRILPHRPILATEKFINEKEEPQMREEDMTSRIQEKIHARAAIHETRGVVHFRVESFRVSRRCRASGKTQIGVGFTFML